MQKWSPEPLVPEPGAAASFEPVAAVAPASDAEGRALRFRSEIGFTDGPTLMAELTTEERAQLYELVEMEVRRDYEARLQRLEEENAAAQTRERQELREAAAAWQSAFVEEIERARAEVHRSLAREAVQLALAVAEKVVRSQVELDSDVLVRALETVLYRLDAGVTMDVTVSERDGERLAGDSELRHALRIGEVKTDRRIEPGGCLVRAGGGEWDATVARQIETLAEVVRETLQVADPPAGDPEDHGSRLD